MADVGGDRDGAGGDCECWLQRLCFGRAGGGPTHARANMPAVLDLIAGGRISPRLVTTDVQAFDAAEAITSAGFKPGLV